MAKRRKKVEMGRTISIGVGLKEGEVAEIDKLATETGFTRNAIMGWMIRYCMKGIDDGSLELPIEEVTRRKLGSP